MNVSSILASDTTAAVVPLLVLVLIIVCTSLGLLLGSVTIALNRKLGRRHWWGFVLGTVTVLFLLLAYYYPYGFTMFRLLQGFRTIFSSLFRAFPFFLAFMRCCFGEDSQVAKNERAQPTCFRQGRYSVFLTIERARRALPEHNR